jgi:uncharacterized oligopeptide transporter (OPT) family protein
LIARAMGELTAIFGRGGDRHSMASVEVPMSWFVLGVGLAGTACVILGMNLFGIRWWMGILAVLLTFLLSIVAARATGETDTTPIGPMGKITQLTYGMIDPGNMKTNLMTAAITAGAASHSADLLQSLKAGYLVGANAKKQAIAQLFGIMVGVMVCVPIYCIIVRTPKFDPKKEYAAAATAEKSAPTAGVAPAAKDEDDRDEVDKEFDKAAATNSSLTADQTKTNLLTAEYNAPAVAVWKSVAELLAEGIKKLPDYSVIGMTIGGILGIVISLLEEYLPKRYIKWVPSATGLGLAGVIMPQNSLSMFLGSLATWIWTKMHAKSCEDYMISGASGLIAGESLTGVGVSLTLAAPTVGPPI